MTPRVLIIIPAYNERETIAEVIADLHEHAPDYDVLVVDDGSLDDTANIVRRQRDVALIQLPYNLGIGNTMQTGYRYALRENYDIAVQCDADGQHPAHQVERIVERVTNGTADLVIGSRYVVETDYVPSLSRRVGKSLLSRLVNSAIGGGITDTTSGFRAMNRAVLSVFVQYYPDDYPEAEALIFVYRHGLRAAEVPVDMRARQGGQTSISPRKAAYYIVKVSLAIFIGMFKKIERPSSGLERIEVTSGFAESRLKKSEAIENNDTVEEWKRTA
ncbi:MAG: glycosyltransferase family 2 protein [Candidatus Hydrogenedentes bacterium]|nr:glycosyltransferase family 2 protein [Candidatus Hydrogenedentota bacterium]